jgi:hypothetical protein
MMSVSVVKIHKNRCRTTIAERMVETLAELPFIGDQVGCLSRDKAARTAERGGHIGGQKNDLLSAAAGRIPARNNLGQADILLTEAVGHIPARNNLVQAGILLTGAAGRIPARSNPVQADSLLTEAAERVSPAGRHCIRDCRFGCQCHRRSARRSGRSAARRDHRLCDTGR